ncbi:MAG TPA: hypothetical protein VFZ09_39895 [Archangium sp.]|uniref:hypothetical protein n=1 Tax=Archangium sp. TaxID=1872627 RepID=UPI002E3150FD|nr:hypothetical protein [Archangium sp.]HEX5752437.1 hypothetical protein [Archangium sp.]
MNRIFLAASLALLPFAFACQPELDVSSEQEATVPSTARSPEGTLTLEKKSGTSIDANHNALSSGDLSVTGLTGVPFASMEAVETVRYEDTWYVHVETAYYVTFWADRARTSPINLGAAIQLNYLSTYYNYMYNTSMQSNLSTTLQPGSHSYYIGSGTYECDYNANGTPDHRCDETWYSLRTGVGYDASY